MMTARQLERAIAGAVRGRDVEIEVGGAQGLRLRLKPSGAMSWALRYRTERGQRRTTIGRYPAMALAAARTEARRVLGRIASGEDPSAQRRRELRARAGATFGDVADEWTSGKLTAKYPDHVRPKRDTVNDKSRLSNYVLPVVGKVPIGVFGIDDAEKVMTRLPAKLGSASRRQIAQLMHRVLSLAVWPLRLREANPLPRGWLPRVGGEKAKAWLYPAEEATLIGCAAVPLGYRVAYAVLSREGMRKGEARSLTWGDIDRKRGVVNLDENKTNDPRSWKLGEDVAEGLRRWWELRGRPDDGLVLTELDGSALFLRSDGDDDDIAQKDRESGLPTRRGLRAHLKLAGVDRAQLFERSASRQPIRLHDLRATFVTLALAAGRSEAWLADRTGHRSSTMINRYRRAARHAGELGLGWLAPLHTAIPELARAKRAKVVAIGTGRRRK